MRFFRAHRDNHLLSNSDPNATLEASKTPIAAGGVCCGINGDGRLDIVNKPFVWQTPRLDIWLNLSNHGVPTPAEVRLSQPSQKPVR